VIVELPVVTATEIAAEYRPGGRMTVKATLRRLRERGLVSAGVSVHPRGSGGRVAGAWHLYSALNLDAARAARAEDEDAARAIVEAAERLEQASGTLEFVRRLAELGGSASLRRRIESASSLDDDLRRSLLSVVKQTMAERNELSHDPPQPPRLASVTRLDETTAEVLIEGLDGSVPLSVADLEQLDSAFVGAALALRFERIGVGQILLTAAPAIKLADERDKARFYPYERPLPDSGAPLTLVAALAAASTIRRPRRIPIAGHR
jgi:hypothetical protein